MIHFKIVFCGIPFGVSVPLKRLSTKDIFSCENSALAKILVLNIFAGISSLMSNNSTTMIISILSKLRSISFNDKSRIGQRRIWFCFRKHENGNVILDHTS